jgi:membrane protease YdiL (CAAX protease family)
MNNNEKNQNYVFRYSLITYLTFWIGILLVGVIYLSTNNDLLMRISTIPLSWIPTIVLLVMFKKLLPNENKKDWVKKSFSSKINIGLVISVTFAFILSVGLTYLIMMFSDSGVEKFDLSSVSLSFIVTEIIFAIVTGATGEELGWRGFLQCHYEKENGGNVIKASVKVGLIWTFWHLLLWFTSTADQPIVFMINHIITFFVMNMSLAVIIAICYSKCRNIFIPMWIHFIANLSLALVNPYFTNNSALMGGKLWLSIFYVVVAGIFVLWHRKQKSLTD